jgi:inorganic pyrophosphatase
MIHKSHPWHGISSGKLCPEEVIAFIEMVSSDTVKYEIDKESGYLKLDRPQKFSNIIPSMYGFIPQTYCGERIAKLANVSKGDGDPLDICVLTERVITHGDIIVQAIPIGGLCLIDKGEADDKIIAVLKDDEIYGKIRDIAELHQGVLQRLKHYFMTYKLDPSSPKNQVEIAEIYGRQHAHKVITSSQSDYLNNFKSITKNG